MTEEIQSINELRKLDPKTELRCQVVEGIEQIVVAAADELIELLDYLIFEGSHADFPKYVENFVTAVREEGM
jgi:hypothetical protein